MTAVDVTMEIYPSDPETRKFMARFNRYEPVVLDHTAMIAAKRCLRMYFYQIVLGFIPKEEAIYFVWGQAYHLFRYILQKEYGYGATLPPKWDEQKAKDAFVVAVQHGVTYWKMHGKDQEVGSKFEFMTTARLLLSFKTAYFHWSRETQRGAIQVLAIEQPFNIQMKDGSFRAGRSDQIVRWSGKVWGRDFKTSSKDSGWYQRQLTPNEQFTGYTWGEAKLSGEDVQGQIVEVLYNGNPTKKDTKGPEIIEFTASRTTWELEMWEKEHAFFKKTIDRCREEDIWPMQEVSCPFCPFFQVCKQSSEAGMMYQLETQYQVRPWDHSKIGAHDL